MKRPKLCLKESLMICMRELATIGVATISYKSVDKDTNRKREC